jgi:hypothetical protein
MDVEVLVPVSRVDVVPQPLASRLERLRGRRIGLLDNQKANAGLLLDDLAAELQRRAGPFEEIRKVKAATTAAPTEVMGRLQRCDAVVLAIAD